jgi:acyl-CoA hydrolase
VDFVRASTSSPGGRSFIALPSTAKSGTISRIVSTLAAGAGVVTTRADVHTIVTEHGVAELHGRSLPERAEALIAVAHPKFRDELRAACTALRHRARR